ncbi:Imm49 family immunity protein [Corallococcus sp. BB11-1]|uniref:Imm49 family immunity protein n=1 Tax=Corallococcus sp. BB11-1 TaxID=2996783 RepID=UPI0022714D5C|nr:Imm49 family immunity protein [Corallococcus sp. BB11-1]MCY1032249.1 Imm49 family immunity protein [Corallococcus sp. BB11-1]
MKSDSNLEGGCAMRSRFLPVYLSNADVELHQLIPLLAGGALGGEGMFLRACRGYRTRGCAAFFLSGRALSLHQDLQRSGAAFAAFAGQGMESDKVTSRAEPFFDAVGCGDEAAARLIARHAPREFKPDRELLEDFLYVRLLMQHFFLESPPAEVASTLANFEAAVVEGLESTRLDVCRALLARDGDAFQGAFQALSDEHRAWYENGFREGRLPEERWALDGCLFIEGLALLRLARTVGIPIASEYPLIPSLALASPKLLFDADAWRSP